jgi:hypothetical protein
MLACAERLGLPVFAGVSNGIDAKLVESAGHTAITSDNIQTGEKWNKTLEAAINHEEKFDAFLIMGDDDSLSDIGLFLLIDAMNLGHEYVGFKTNGYYELRTGNAMKHRYKHKIDKLIGAGRMISRNAVIKTCYSQTVKISRELRPYQTGQIVSVIPAVAEYLCGYSYAKREGDPVYSGLWPKPLRNGLDNASELKLVLNGFVPHAVDDGRIHLTDFKTEKNIWPYSILENKCTEIESDEATWFLSYDERDLLRSFRK